MKLIDLIKKFPKHQIFGTVPYIDITKISTSLDGAGPDTMVIYNLKDSEDSKEKFIERLALSNAKIVVVPFYLEIDSNVCMLVSDLFFKHHQYKEICNFVYGEVGDIKLIGVTGTNGKTTTAFLINQMLNQVGLKAAYVGTIGFYVNNLKMSESSLTSPDYFKLREHINFCNKNKISFLCIEVSSHSLDQDRLGDLKLIVAGWTNLTQDHLDYHKTFENYFLAKCKIIEKMQNGAPLYLSYDETNLCQEIKKANLAMANSISLSSKVNPELLTTDFLRADFNIKNFSLAVSMLKGIGVNYPIESSSQLMPSPGRFYLVQYKSGIIIDYAHTPDGVEKVLKAVRALYPNKLLKIVFGCGGNRDKTKRPIMGKIASDLADSIIITNDNPRFELEIEIAKQIASGIVGKEYEIICDRKQAIIGAIKSMDLNTIVLILGKGHEDYQEINGVKHKFSDELVVKEVIGK